MKNTHLKKPFCLHWSLLFLGSIQPPNPKISGQWHHPDLGLSNTKGIMSPAILGSVNHGNIERWRMFNKKQTTYFLSIITVYVNEATPWKYGFIFCK